MNKLLTRLNANMEKKIGAVSESVEEVDHLKLYKSLLENGGSTEILFSAADDNGTFISADDNGVQLFLLKEDMKISNLQRRTGVLLGTNLSVVVKDIDEEANAVYFKMPHRKNTVVEEINRAIQDDLDKDRSVRITGRVLRIVPPSERGAGRAWVRLLDQDVLGTISVKDWASTYTNRLEEVCAVGELYEFDVIGQGENDGRKGRPVWRLSRRDISANPWDSLPPIFKENGIILIKATEKPENKSYFWGSSPLVPGLNIMCNYPSARLLIVTGAYYRCKIDKLDPANRFFRVSPFAACPIRNSRAVDFKRLAHDVSIAEQKE